MRAEGSFTASFTLDGSTLTLTLCGLDGTDVYIAESPDNPAKGTRNTVILRRKAKSAKFTAIFKRTER